MIVRFFLPHSVYSLKSVDSSECYLIIGKIKCNDGGNVSVFIVDTKEIDEFGIVNSNQNQQHAIGCILPENETHKKQLLHNDSILFTSGCSNSSEKLTLQLKSVHLPDFISESQPFQIQMFLYDFQTFTDVAQRIDGLAWSQRPDAIAQLLVLIKNNEWRKLMGLRFRSVESSSTYKYQPSPSNQNHLIPFLLTISLFIQTKLTFLNSAFVRHFHFWTANLEKLTQNR